MCRGGREKLLGVNLGGKVTSIGGWGRKRKREMGHKYGKGSVFGEEVSCFFSCLLGKVVGSFFN